MTSEPKGAVGVFISYSHEDRFVAETLAGRLAAIGFDPWIDFTGLMGGARWRQEIEDALRQAAAMVVVMTPNSMGSEWVHFEIERALEIGTPIVPLMVTTCEPMEALKSIQWIDFRGGPAYDQLQRALLFAVTRYFQQQAKTTEQESDEIVKASEDEQFTIHIDGDLSGTLIVAGDDASLEETRVGVRRPRPTVISGEKDQEGSPGSPVARALAWLDNSGIPPLYLGAGLAGTALILVVIALLGGFGGGNGSGGQTETPGPVTPTDQDPAVILTDVPVPNATPLGGSHVIAYYSYTDGDGEIYLLNFDEAMTSPDTVQPQQITYNTVNDITPSWSPDGKYITFASRRDGGDNDIYVMDADGRNARRLTSDPAEDYSPRWSPDGEQIAFVSDREDSESIYVINADGTGGLTRLTSPSANDSYPNWSPDGSRLVFYSDRDGDLNVYLMDADGSGERALTENPANDWAPTWDPDGDQIVFTSQRDGNTEIYRLSVSAVLNGREGNEQRLTFNTIDDYAPSVSPDGQWILYYASVGENQDGLFVMPRNGGQPTRLVNQDNDARNGVWRPPKE